MRRLWDLSSPASSKLFSVIGLKSLFLRNYGAGSVGFKRAICVVHGKQLDVNAKKVNNKES